MDEDSSMKQKTWQVYSLGKSSDLRFDEKRNPEMVSDGEEGEDHSVRRD